jgi:hypothetical protein
MVNHLQPSSNFPQHFNLIMMPARHQMAGFADSHQVRLDLLTVRTGQRATWVKPTTFWPIQSIRNQAFDDWEF